MTATKDRFGNVMPRVIISRKTGDRYTLVPTDKPLIFHTYLNVDGFCITNVTINDIDFGGKLNRRFIVHFI